LSLLLTGKTKVICHRVAFLVAIMNIRPTRIILMTFTTKAAKEMKSRVIDLIGLPAAKEVRMGNSG